ncbi:MAG: VWA domain-containing protein, partial [bacterium]|nr:VWA domain-containing protein [bacterium]
PGLVVFVIMTDGKENSSREFTNAQVKEMIETQQSVYSWRFLFLGANQDAFAEAGGMGIDAVGVAQYAASKTRAAYATMSRVTTSLRTQTQANETIDTSITDDERTQME